MENMRDSQSGSQEEDRPNPINEQAASAQDFRANSFAKKDTLSQWLPQIRHGEGDSWRIYLSRRSRALLMQILLICIILSANIGLTTFAMMHYGSQNGVGTIYEGDCNKIKSLDQWLHLLINVLSTGMLSASNFCMQLQAAPTRGDIDRAHQGRDSQEGRWLDIGVPSLRNLRYVSKWRRIAWAILGMSSLPVHLMYNSAVFQSLASNDYTIAVVKDSFVNGSSWNLTTAETNRRGDFGWDEERVNPSGRNYTDIITNMQENVLSEGWQEMNLSGCFALYNDYFAPQGNGVIFVKNDTGSEDDSLLMYVSIMPRSDDWAKNMWALMNGSTSNFVARSPALPITKWFLGPKRYEVSHCRVQSPGTITNECRLEYSPYIMLTVSVLNFIKVFVMLCIWFMRKWPDAERDDADKVIICTLGDAIASFMRKPDPTTIDMGLSTKDDYIRRRPWRYHHVKRLLIDREPREWENKRSFWFKAASIRRWFILIFFCCLTVAIAAILLGISFTGLQRRHFSTDIPSLWQLGFGTLTPYTYLVVGLPREDPEGLIVNVLLANLPQIVLSILYIFYNAMLSTFLVQREFSRMCLKERKPLRVSEPIGIQRSTYFISVPLRFGLPLYVSSGLMHWLVSQSLFLARITAICADGSPDICPAGQVDVSNSFSTCGYSPFALFVTLLVGSLAILIVVGMGLRKYDGTMPMVSTNSMAISAACHVLEEDRKDGYLLPIQWGVVEMKDGIGKCTFTTAPSDTIQMPATGLKYR